MSSTTIDAAISRRDFLRLAAMTGAAAAGASLLAGCAPPAEPAASPDNHVPEKKDPTMNEQMNALIRYAVLAPSGHNTQPWTFHALPDALEIHPDSTRRLPVVDPLDRELYISLGCALENLTAAAVVHALTPHVEIFPADLPGGIRIRLAGNGNPQDQEILSVMEKRQCTRTLYDGRPIPEEDWRALSRLGCEEGTALHAYRTEAERAVCIDLVRRGDLIQFSQADFKDELISWIRFNESEAQRTRDGLFSRCSGNPSVPRIIGSLFLRLSSPESMAQADEKNMRSSPAFMLITSTADEPVAWVKTGQVCQRLALEATRRGLKYAFLNQPVEVPELRTEMGQSLHLGGGIPQLFLRLGYAEPAPYSLRRQIEDVVI